ncbi:tail fiber domain-containing protein [Burkholderia sp. IDO3]|uniref:tail fiber domain-containing protein n=1 Tax=Burkholderia sp. IDO3 TaxID=1705310 RepID=UPI000BBA8DAF|nr:tail fiber domain-containing protein [Burkholderia sp. IDO3]AXK65946.1 hypothetical protein DCN14_25860 [Burkholderia sp. IDO3]PCD58821.1 hypothetical protein CN645_26105 [Burkholderia sp. IDO3]
MTVNSSTQSVTYNGDGSTTDFPIPFYFLLNEDIEASLAKDGAGTDLVFGTDFFLSGAGLPGGGTLTMFVAPPTGYQLVIERQVAITQQREYQQNDPFPAKTTEKALDKLTMICQQIWAIFGGGVPGLSRALLLGKYDINGFGAYRANNNRIANLGDPIADTDAANMRSVKSYADAGDKAVRTYAETLVKGIEPGGGYVTYFPAENPTFGILVKKALDETVDLKTKFGLTGDENDDQTGPLNDLIEYVNGLNSWGGSAKVVGCYRVTGALQDLKNGLRLVGQGFARSRIMFDGVNGLVFDLSGQPGVPVFPILEDIALTTTATFASGFSAVKVKPWLTTRGYSRTFQSIRVQTCSESIWRGDNQAPLYPEEWAIHYELGELGSEYNLFDCHIDDAIIYGSFLNEFYNSQTGAKGIVANDLTGLRVFRPKMEALSTCTQIRGRSEGLVMTGGTHVDCGYGAVFSDYTNPANNHVISDTHFKVHFRGIQMQDTGTTYQRAYNMFTNVFVLEKTTPDAKPDGFIGIEAYCTNSAISNCYVRSDQSYTSTATMKIGFRVGKGDNHVVACGQANMRYLLDPVPFAAGPAAGNVWVSNLQRDSAGTGIIGPTSGIVLGDFRDAYGSPTYKQEWWSQVSRYDPATGSTWGYDAITSMLRNPSSTYTNRYHTSTSTASADSSIVHSGGDTAGNANNGGAIAINAATTTFSGAISPTTDNARNNGTAALRWKEFFAGTGAINTSDARLKSAVRSLNANEIAAAQALVAEIGAYQFLAMITEKGTDGARLHVGMTVQRAIEIMQAHGLDPMRYSFICYDKWDAIDAVLDEDGAVAVPAREAGDLYSFRDNELLFFMLAGMLAAQLALADRVTALESKAA